jgi:hypothetical protein
MVPLTDPAGSNEEELYLMAQVAPGDTMIQKISMRSIQVF